MKMQLKSICLALCVCALNSIAGDGPIRIDKPANYLIPISVTGFTGEVLSVVTFDLEVLGMEVTSPDKADYIIKSGEL